MAPDPLREITPLVGLVDDGTMMTQQFIGQFSFVGYAGRIGRSGEWTEGVCSPSLPDAKVAYYETKAMDSLLLQVR